MSTHLESLVLKHTLDGSVLSAGRQLCLEDDAEGAIADDFALRVREVLVVASHAVLDFLADDLCSVVSSESRKRRSRYAPPILSDEKADGRFWLIVRREAEEGSGPPSARRVLWRGGLAEGSGGSDADVGGEGCEGKPSWVVVVLWSAVSLRSGVVWLREIGGRGRSRACGLVGRSQGKVQRGFRWR